MSEELKTQAEPKQVEIMIPNAETESPTAKDEQPKKTRKKRAATPAKLEADPVLVTNLNMLVGAVTAGVSSVTKNPIWQFSPEETQAISEPLARILERMGAAEVSSKYGDYIALTLAVGSAIIPRVILSKQIQQQKQQTPPDQEVLKIDQYKKPTARKQQPKKQIQSGDRRDTQDVSGDLASLVDERIPSLVD